MSSDIDWLLEPENPSVHYRTLTEILGNSYADSEVQRAKKAILTSDHDLVIKDMALFSFPII